MASAAGRGSKVGACWCWKEAVSTNQVRDRQGQRIPRNSQQSVTDQAATMFAALDPNMPDFGLATKDALDMEERSDGEVDKQRDFCRNHAAD